MHDATQQHRFIDIRVLANRLEKEVVFRVSPIETDALVGTGRRGNGILVNMTLGTVGWGGLNLPRNGWEVRWGLRF